MTRDRARHPVGANRAWKEGKEGRRRRVGRHRTSQERSDTHLDTKVRGQEGERRQGERPPETAVKIRHFYVPTVEVGIKGPGAR